MLTSYKLYYFSYSLTSKRNSKTVSCYKNALGFFTTYQICMRLFYFIVDDKINEHNYQIYYQWRHYF